MGNIWTAVAFGCSAFLLLTDVILRMADIRKRATAPNAEQNRRIKELEDWKTKVEDRLNRGNVHFEKVDESSRVTMVALLALLDHTIDGNNISQLQHAKQELTTHLVNK